MDITSLITSKDATQKGREFAFGDAFLTIAASGNTEHRKALRRLYEPHAKLLAFGGSLDPEVGVAVDDAAMAEAVLVGWRGLMKDDKPFPYNRENALWLLQNVAMLRNFVVKASEDAALYTIGAVDAAKEVLKKKLTWELKAGAQAEWLEAVAAEGFAVPLLDERPKLHPIHAELYEAFTVLSSSRNVGMGVSYIPVSEILCYAREIGYDNRLDFIAIIRSMDDVFVKHQNESQREA